MKNIHETNPPVGSIIYNGSYDVSQQGKQVKICFQNEYININIDNVITIGNPDVKNLSLQDIMFLCSELNLECEIFPNNNCHFSEQSTGKTTYLSVVKSKGTNYLVCLSFIEKQPSLYEAELLGLFII